MPATTTKPPETDELQEQQRAMVQLRQSEEFTMGGHIRKKLKMGRKRLAETWGQEADESEEDDDMQVLARDIIFTEQAAAPTPAPPAPAPVAPPPPAAEPKAKWPLAAALALGLGIPGTVGVLMAPKIIDAMQGDKPQAVVEQPDGPEYAPILLPGRPAGVE